MRISDWSSDVCSSDLWTIFRALSDKLGCTLPFDSFEGLRAEMVKAVPALGELGLATYAWAPPKLFADPKGDLAHPIKDFYLTKIGRASCRERVCQYV